MKILVTGGAGFIGSAFVRQACAQGRQVVVVDKLDYAADLARIKESKKKFKFYKADITNRSRMLSIFKKERPEAVINFAAQTHVDRSIRTPGVFIDSNVKGTQVLLDCAMRYPLKRFVQISTDEVYGEALNGEFSENEHLNPSSPYSASKAAADLMVKAYIRTFSFPALIVRLSNCYGPWQYPEKFIPLSIMKVMRGGNIPLYGNGRNIREWLYVDDACEGIMKVLDRGLEGEIYNLGSGQEKQNIEVAREILLLMKKDPGQMEFIKDRPGHDRRYKLHSAKIEDHCRWKARMQFEDGLSKTIEWCQAHRKWLLGKWKKIKYLYR